MSKRLSMIFLLFLCAAAFSVVVAQSGQFDLPWHTIDGGAGASSGGDYVIQSVIGQPEAGEVAGGAFGMGGGFLVQPVLNPAEQNTVFVPLLVKPP